MKPAPKGGSGKKAPAATAPKSKTPVATAKPTSKPPGAVAKVEAAPASSAASGSEGLIIKKKKVKRGAPPMLPRRLPRRALPPLEGGVPLPPKPTTPGSLHAPARAPEGAEKLKANLTRAMNALAKLKSLKRNIQRQFWEAALILQELSSPDLYQARGYGSWESFLEREIERDLGIGRMQAMDLVKIVKIFQREAAEEIGQDRLRRALKEIYPEQGTNTSSGSSAGSSG